MHQYDASSENIEKLFKKLEGLVNSKNTEDIAKNQNTNNLNSPFFKIKNTQPTTVADQITTAANILYNLDAALKDTDITPKICNRWKKLYKPLNSWYQNKKNDAMPTNQKEPQKEPYDYFCSMTNTQIINSKNKENKENKENKGNPYFLFVLNENKITVYFEKKLNDEIEFTQEKLNALKSELNLEYNEWTNEVTKLTPEQLQKIQSAILFAKFEKYLKDVNTKLTVANSQTNSLCALFKSCCCCFGKKEKGDTNGLKVPLLPKGSINHS